MPSSLTWLDHDSEARERALRILSLFQERESRDELGLGAVRDGLADLLFPGTSTLQTRLKYMLFVPWIYLRLEEQHLQPPHFGQRADAIERRLVGPLVAGEDNAGVFGRTAGRALKRLPSSVYWAGLGAWGIRRTPYSQSEYHGRIAETYRAKASLRATQARRSDFGDDADAELDAAVENWHPRLPPRPVDFPDTATMALNREEAEFLLDRICTECHGSLLAQLAQGPGPAVCDAPWEHPDYASFSTANKTLLGHARRFSELMHGASLSYNLQLARLSSRTELANDYEARIDEWFENLDRGELRDWKLDELWKLTGRSGRRVSGATKAFVRHWQSTVTASSGSLHRNETALILVRRRERTLKGPQSRFRNMRALDQWSGASGVGRLVYRWPNVQGLLRDLSAGLNR